MATQLLDFCSDEDGSVGELAEDQELGRLMLMGSSPVVSLPLFIGANVVGRQDVEQEEVEAASLVVPAGQEQGRGLFLKDQSVSLKHAIIYIEGGGEDVFLKDLNSRNRTFLQKKGKFKPLTADRYAIESGDIVKFGAVECQVLLQPEAEATDEASAGIIRDGNQAQAFEATQVWAADDAQGGAASPGREHTGEPGSIPLASSSLQVPKPASALPTSDDEDEAQHPVFGSRQVLAPFSAASNKSHSSQQPQSKTATQIIGGASTALPPRLLQDVLGTPDSADNDSEWNPALSGEYRQASGELPPVAEPHTHEQLEISSPSPRPAEPGMAASSGWRRRARPRHSASEGESWDLQASRTTRSSSGPLTATKDALPGHTADSKALTLSPAAAAVNAGSQPGALPSAALGPPQADARRVQQRPPVQRNLMASSQAFGTQAVDAALSDIGHLTSMFPDTQQIAQPASGPEHSDERGVTSLPTKSPEHAAEDLPEPAKRERSAKAQAEQHSPLTGEKRVPEAAAVVNAPEAASPGIAIVSPRADGGPTSPGLMTQLAAGVLDSLAGDQRAAEPAPAAGRMRSSRGRGRQTRGRGRGRKDEVAPSADPYAFPESAPQRSGSTDPAAAASDSSADVQRKGTPREGPVALKSDPRPSRDLLTRAAADETPDDGASHPHSQAQSLKAAGQSRSTQRQKNARERKSGSGLEEAVTPGPQRDLRKVDHRDVRVLFSTTVSEKERQSLTRILKRLGGKDAGKQSIDFSHFVTMQPARRDKELGFKKSFSTLLAMAAGRPIVGGSWLEASSQAGSFVDPRNHLLVDDTAEKRHGFNLATAYERAQHRLLLTDKHVLLSPGLRAAEKDRGEGLRVLISAAGGTNFEFPANSVQHDPADCLVLGTEAAADKERKWCHNTLGEEWSMFTRNSFTDCILQQTLEGLVRV
ncbi:hypothetical protein WJX84_011640 [Apatococcus fuscideae]|uniref:Mediator of DNA damage checkpoint protein 1 n=1 Tax=Apatococcus fuscideae TaxID=2026836 RepID=A0AAW1TKC5_9CHLO